MTRFLCVRVPIRGAAAAVLAAMLLVTLFAGQAPGQAAQDAGGFLVELTDRAVDRLTEPGLDADEQERRFRSLVQEGFDIAAIGRFVLGRYWRRAIAEDQAAFLVTFEDLLVHRFLPLFSEYSGEKLDIGLIRPFRNNPTFVSVSSKLVQGGEPIHVEWRVRRRDGGYKIVDVVAEGISIAVTLRSEYASVLKRNGGDVADLVRTLRAKIAGI